jgi:hypothetical protein
MAETRFTARCYYRPAPSNGLLVQGNVGIGATGPSYPLHIVGSGSNTNLLGIRPSPQSVCDNPVDRQRPGATHNDGGQAGQV